ncbi:MAG: transglutaminase-like domain-containing protein [Thermodesulfovibrionales bacterium]
MRKRNERRTGNQVITCSLSRRAFLFGTFFLLGEGIYPVLTSAKTIEDRNVRSVSLKITYTTEILRPPKAGLVRIWMPVPRSDHAQEIKGVDIKSKISGRITEDRNNKIFYLETGRLKAGERIILSFHLDRRIEGIHGGEPDEGSLKPSEWEKWDKNIMDFAERVIGNERDTVRIGRKVFDAIIDRLNYVHEVCGRGVSSIAFEERAGRCDEFHALFRSMMMYKGIPVRWEQGILLPYPSEMKKKGEIEADCINAHSWVSFYSDRKWVPVDISEAKRRPEMRDFYFGRIPPDRIKFSSGRGIDLVPKQEDIINTFAYTYIEADGVPVVYGHNYRNRLRYEVMRMKIG